jgi:Cof subfamily protein (haloacid dehalogenase superfamily)
MRMVACDLDGTIVCPDGTISRRTLEVLARCERAGIHVVFVTGRPPRWMAPIVEMTAQRGLALCGNGAVVIDLASGEVIRADGLTAETVLEVTDRLRNLVPGATFALETLDGYRREEAYRPLNHTATAIPAGPVQTLLEDRPTVIKVLCRQATEEPTRLDSDQMLAIARPAVADLAEVVHSDPANHLLEISARGVTKASALAWLAESLQVDAADVVAFGDMPNDVPMLAWAGSGYAMAGGHPDAIAAAAAQAPPCTQDGVAQVLELLLAG